jgi:hypothetical protein
LTTSINSSAGRRAEQIRDRPIERRGSTHNDERLSSHVHRTVESFRGAKRHDLGEFEDVDVRRRFIVRGGACQLQQFRRELCEPVDFRADPVERSHLMFRRELARDKEVGVCSKRREWGLDLVACVDNQLLLLVTGSPQCVEHRDEAARNFAHLATRGCVEFRVEISGCSDLMCRARQTTQRPSEAARRQPNAAPSIVVMMPIIDSRSPTAARVASVSASDRAFKIVKPSAITSDRNRYRSPSMMTVVNSGSAVATVGSGSLTPGFDVKSSEPSAPITVTMESSSTTGAPDRRPSTWPST